MKARTWMAILIVVLSASLASAGCDKKNQQTTDHSPDKETEKAHGEMDHGEMDHGEMDHGEMDHGEMAAPTDVPEDQSREGATENGDFYVTLTPDPNPIPFQELFELKVDVWESDAKDTRVEDASLDEVRATMPAHKHGMKTQPKVITKGPGQFVVEGMKFHMQGPGEDGKWVFHLTVNAEGTIDTAKFDVQCCRAQ